MSAIQSPLTKYEEKLQLELYSSFLNKELSTLPNIMEIGQLTTDTFETKEINISRHLMFTKPNKTPHQVSN